MPVVTAGDLGAGEAVPTTRRLAGNVTWLTHWGLAKDRPSSGWKQAHDPQRVRADREGGPTSCGHRVEGCTGAGWHVVVVPVVGGA